MKIKARYLSNVKKQYHRIMSLEKKKLFGAIYIPAMLVLLMWLIKLFESIFGLHLSFLGVYPMSWEGLHGILSMPLVHSGFKHISANTAPFLVLGIALFYFYREISVKVLIGIWLLSGIWVWFGARGDSWHIGASGVIYGLSAFLFFSGAIRKDTRLAALALVVAFLYGSLVWGMFPDFYPKENISFEGHMGGFVAGIVLAIYFRKKGPQPKQYSWELEEEIEEDDDAYWKLKNTNNT